MRARILLYLAGLGFALLNPAPWGLTVSACMALVAALCSVQSRLRPAAALCLGLAWGGANVALFLSASVLPWPAGEAATLHGEVTSFAVADGDSWTFELRPEPRHLAGSLARPRVLVRYAESAPLPGSWCYLKVRLYPVRGLVNRGQRDFARGLVARRVVASANVIRHPANLCAAIATPFGPAGLRYRVSRAIDEAIAHRDAAAIIRALAVADRSAISTQQWETARVSGTAHLLAISGLHISLCAALAFGVARRMVSLCCVPWQGYPAVRLAWLAAGFAAVAYAALAGFATSASRAALMVVFTSVAVISGRRVFSLDGLLLALASLATADPLLLLSDGLWLSFMAVGTLLFCAVWLPTDGSRLHLAIRTHLVMTFAMLPVTTALLGSVSWLAPLANLVALPWCSVFVIPLVLLGLLSCFPFPGFAAVCWDMAARCWNLLDPLLRLSLEPPLRADVLPGTGPLWVLLCLFAIALVLLPAALGFRWLGVGLICSALSVGPTRPAAGVVHLEVFDVGQGLAVHIRTRRADVLFDTGPGSWRGKSDLATRVVLPGLRHAGVTELDALILSHLDYDHRGGLGSVLRAYPGSTVLTPEGAGPINADRRAPCVSGQTWQSDGVSFRWLSAAQAVSSRNDRSCVLLIDSPYGRVLLPGDIEQAGESALVRQFGGALRADVLLVPHHGSRTSSSAPFLRQVAPQAAIISAGAGNRYGFPHAEVTRRYVSMGVHLLNTAVDGAVAIEVGPGGIVLESERHRRGGFWNAARPLSSADAVW